MQNNLFKGYFLERKSPNNQQQYLELFSYSRKRQYTDVHVIIQKQQQKMAVVLIAFILLQHADLYVCFHISANQVTSQNYDDALYAAKTGKDNSITTTAKRSVDGSNNSEVGGRQIITKKRRIEGGQPEEIFSFDVHSEANYDEYPMVVPKRAALLLDRLMVALHHALEQERRKISDFYAESSDKYPNIKNENTVLNTDDSSANHMYSDDDPSILTDYDFKDLNSINRATGETRRGNIGVDLGGNLGDVKDAAMLTAAAATDNDSGGVGGSVGRNGIGNGGRMYWRCYFNAVSCF
ncbi:uncharacterized protein LOC101462522 isoform X2 [Ceratitis capitata]|uniref:uncharacterized protein LOC101462522 isoform X2 n=1 Tax=Ceratitis capitata TaxID=7213 RepID=UPI0006188D52|nr:uncharacterized protein LOC101462522 isoform X2 [Ceratitis capitata]